MNTQNSLALIEEMINKAKNNFNESGTLYLVWGVVILICSLTQFIATYFFNYQYAYYVWFLTWAVYIYQAIFLSRKSKQEKVKTYTDEILGYVWICFIICFFILIFILTSTKKFDVLYSAILVLYGMPTFLSGAILKVRSLFIGAIICWLLAILSLFIAIEYHSLLISIAVIFGWIIPGIIMRKKFINQLQQNG